jgi:hypothetical protein
VTFEVKRCPRCRKSKPVTDFASDSSRTDGRMQRCRACDAARARDYYAAHRESVLARQRPQKRGKYAGSRLAAIEPLDLVCPQCRAEPGYGCVWPDPYGEQEFPHAARVTKAQAIRAGAANPDERRPR